MSETAMVEWSSQTIGKRSHVPGAYEALVDVLDIFKELLQVLNDDDIEIHNVNDHPFFSDG